MPERNEVLILSEQINKEFSGWYLKKIKTDGNGKYDKISIKGSSKLKLPIKLISVTSKGKKIIFHFEGDIFILSSPNVEGRWLLEKGNYTNLWFKMFKIKDGEKIFRCLWYDDLIKRGLIEIIYGKKGLEDRLKKIGPDIIKDNIDLETFTKIIRNRRIKNKPLCEFLNDQSRLSGIGNYMRAEILYRAKLRPDRSLDSLLDDEIFTLYEKYIDVVKESYKNGGCTLKTYKDLYGNKGNFKLRVYGKKFDADGNKIEIYVHGNPNAKTKKQGVYWCPNVQNNIL